MTRFDVFAEWDAEASVWVAHSDAFPGLVAEDSDWNSLKAKLAARADELIALNGVQLDADGGELVINIADNAVSVAA